MLSSLKRAILAFIVLFVGSIGNAVQISTLNANNNSTTLAQTAQLDADVRNMLAYLNNVQQMVNANYSATIPGTQDTYTMTPQQQSDMWNAYAAYKAQVQIDLNNMP